MAINQFPASDTGGIPSGNTASRPSSPVIGDTFYNGQLGILEIFDGSNFIPCSAPPGVPTIATPTDASTGDAYTSTAGKLSVVFTPSVNGGLVSQYNALTTAGGHSAFSSQTTVTITGLTPGTAYTVFGNSQNNFGTSVNTGNASAVTPTTLPEVPTIGTATASTSANEVTVSWTLGNNGGKNLSAITITPFLNGTTAETSRTAATTSSTSYTFTTGQVTAGANYTFKVKATNANGSSADSTATNSVTVASLFNVDYLVVAGGGGGGVLGGGGGAGGLRSTVTGTGGSGSLETTLVLTPSTNYTVTVGGGATGAANENARGGNGSNSVFATITSTGGGGGGSDFAGGFSGNAGGSGGGSGNGVSSGGAASPSGQGFAGGSNNTGGSTGAGGGGASAVGANVNSIPNNGADGGNGRAVSITGSSVTYAGGGGGGARRDSGSTLQTGGVGGTGGGGTGGGAGSGYATAVAGTVNTGGGGGGAGYGPTGYNGTGANGGKGVVILRWLTAAGSITVGAGLTADSTGTDGSYSYKRFTDGSGNVSFA